VARAAGGSVRKERIYRIGTCWGSVFRRLARRGRHRHWASYVRRDFRECRAPSYEIGVAAESPMLMTSRGRPVRRLLNRRIKHADRHRKVVDTQKRFGSVAPDNGGSDVFLHISAVQRVGLPGLAEGQKIKFTW